VLVAGKGHETYQEIAAPLPFDDLAVARAALRRCAHEAAQPGRSRGLGRRPPARRDAVDAGAARCDRLARAMLREGALFVACAASASTATTSPSAPRARRRRGCWSSAPLPVALPQVVVADTRWRWAAGRRRCSASRHPVFGLTGSNGKTTVKTLLHGILSRRGRAYANPATATTRSACRWR
jgi:UDP-N-acetylmuramyl tripeptide synthase